jgi:hypothetical protein
MFRQRKTVVTTEVRKIPTPLFTSEQTEVLAALHKEIVAMEEERITTFVASMRQNMQRRLKLSDEHNQDIEISSGEWLQKLTALERRTYDEFVRKLHLELQAKIDEIVFTSLDIPRDIQLLVKDFIEHRLPLDKPAEVKRLTREPSQDELLTYARALQTSLNDFAMGMVYHRISITYSNELIECVVELIDRSVHVNEDDIDSAEITMAGLLAELGQSLREKVSQWVYVQRGLRLFDGPRVYIYKSPRLIDWTYVQALNDAGDIIGSSLTHHWGNYEAEPA